MCPHWFHFSRSAGLLFVLGSLLVAPAPAQSPPDTTDTRLQEAIATVDSLRQAGDFQPALNRLQTLRDESPERVDVLWRLVYTWADLGQVTDDEDQRTSYYENALEVAKAGLAADSSSARAHLAMAVAQGRAALDAGTQERIQRSRAVKRHADRALVLDSTLSSAYHTRGRWYREVADIGFFKRTIAKAVYGGLPDASYEQAVQDFERAIEFNDKIFHHLELAKTYLQMNQTSAARRELNTALNMPNDDPFAPQYKEEARGLLEELE